MKCFSPKNQHCDPEKNIFFRIHPTSREFIFRRQAWNELTAINTCPLSRVITQMKGLSSYFFLLVSSMSMTCAPISLHVLQLCSKYSLIEKLSHSEEL